MNWYPPTGISYEKYAHAERISAKAAAARAAIRISVFLSAGINKIRIPVIMGVKTIMLRIGNCILHLDIGWSQKQAVYHAQGRIG
jgi:hypothetical protein